jgi:hypothetical protein
MLDIGAVIEQSIRDDIVLRKSNIANQKRAIARAAKLRARVKRKGGGADNALARVLEWHERSTQDHVWKNEEAVHSMERALEILENYSFLDDAPSAAEGEMSVALHDAIKALEELAATFNAQPKAAMS